MSQAPFFHEPSGTVRFWVLVDDLPIGASIGKETLHYRYQPHRSDDDALQTYLQNSAEIDAAVRRRFAAGFTRTGDASGCWMCARRRAVETLLLLRRTEGGPAQTPQTIAASSPFARLSMSRNGHVR